ncbi:MAG: carbonic anhydrase [Ardenticatenaceae bacterium]|nr:carbonic anhydrase [Ardenticatenaceae bacterium]MCB9443526.1 carbonic anhydrase [Ardenticatenaceae bacterium]
MSDSILVHSVPARRSYFEKHGELIQKLAQHGQSPHALFIGCSDSRIMPEQILGAEPGDFFMIRNVANIIPPYYQTEIGIVSALEFAIFYLNVSHVIVCGHTDCGGIKGLDTWIDMSQTPALSRWLDLARPSQRDVDFAMRNLSPEERHRAIVERNVINQLNNLQSYPFVRERLEADRLELHGWVLHLETQQISTYNPESSQFTIF